MPFSAVEKEFNELTDEQKNSILTIIHLYNEANNKPQPHKKNHVLYGAFKGGLNYISDDFDEIPEGFEEYI